jgi:hypothetical protein
MKNIFLLLILSLIVSCEDEGSIFQQNVSIQLSTYTDGNATKAAALPVLNEKSEFIAYKRRFEYLLMNIPEIHLFEKMNERNQINELYPDTMEIKRRYMERYCNDQKLIGYFDEMTAPILNADLVKDKTYSVAELMDVASVFFYCDQVNPDTTIQMHVCIGINGIKETKWEKDYTLLAAFCYEAIFDDLGKDNSSVREAYVSEKMKSCEKFKPTISSLEKYLEDVRLDLFDSMKKNAVLKEKLLAYYELNAANLPFVINH